MRNTQTSLERDKQVRMDKDAIYIEGKPVIVLCSSLFYFRIPHGLWLDRIRKVKEAGYNCIDVYLPWNFHELCEGEWDFSGDKDVTEFLRLAAREGLWVMARPGPYICSEWDGGALPSYLFTDQNMKLRDNDPSFLKHVSRWFEKIMPILKDFEVGQGGSVIAVQLDNELDFYDCRDRTGYIGALRDMAQSYGISVPLFSCAGQGDLFGATGHADEVMPACNFYPDDKDSHVESMVYHYYQVLQDQKYPLCVTETNRTHYLLRRLLAGGTKLLGPYNQVSGTDFGFTNSINNWGDPVAFLTSDYDFQGMISPEGTRRKEHNEGRLLGQFIRGMGAELATAQPRPETEIKVNTDMKLPDDGIMSLHFNSGGRVLFLPNMEEEDRQVTFQSGTMTFPQQGALTVPVDHCQMVLYDVPLSLWSLEGTIEYATAELGDVHQEDSEVTMVFHSLHECEIALTLPESSHVEANGMEVVQQGSTQVLRMMDPDQLLTHVSAVIHYANGSCLKIAGMSSLQAAQIDNIEMDGSFSMRNMGEKDDAHQPQVKMAWEYADLHEKEWVIPESKSIDQVVEMEKEGYYRGYGWYGCRYEIREEDAVEGVLLHGASDVISLYCNDHYQGTTTPGGGFAFYPLAMNDPSLDLLMRCEIWGHTNFDDPVLPALSLNALKGIQNLTMVHVKEELAQGWSYLPVSEEKKSLPEYQSTEEDWKRTSWDGFLTRAQPKKGYHYKALKLPEEWAHQVLHFKGIEAVAKVYINGTFVAYVNPLNPYVDLTGYVSPGESCELMVYMEQYFGESGGAISVMYGQEAKGWWMNGKEEQQLLQSAEGITSADSISVALPLALSPGEIGWLTGKMDVHGVVHPTSWMVYAQGKNAKMTIFFNGKLVGRLWLPSSSRPVFTGGGQDRFYLPHSVGQHSNNHLWILVEAIEKGDEANIEKLHFEEVKE